MFNHHKQSTNELVAKMGAYALDPVSYVREMFPWMEPGVLQNYAGPDIWQLDFLERLGENVRKNGFTGKNPVPPIRMAVSSGHGVGKSTLVSWVASWIMDTRPNCRITVTANSYPQLESTTWPSICHWKQMAMTSSWYQITNSQIFHVDHPKTWFMTPKSCKEENSQSFAGQHAATSTSAYLFDEASTIPDKIWEVAEGGLTDGEPMIFAFGNPTENTGKFYRICFGSERNRWDSVTVDSRKSMLTNKAQLQQWIDDWGVDSDFVRVRILGLPPAASAGQFISRAMVKDAMRRNVMLLGNEPLVIGVDLSRGGEDMTVIYFRRGVDGASIKPIKIKGEDTRDSMQIATKIGDILSQEHNGMKVSTAFIDATGGSIGGPIANRLQQLGWDNVIEVQFGGKSPAPQYANMRAYMWGKMRDWLRTGAIVEDIDLEQDLCGPLFFHNRKDQIALESKELMKGRGLGSPDCGDALAMTFAQEVSPSNQWRPYNEYQDIGKYGGDAWMM